MPLTAAAADNPPTAPLPLPWRAALAAFLALWVGAASHRIFVAVAIWHEMPDGARLVDAAAIALQPAWADALVAGAGAAVGWAIGKLAERAGQRWQRRLWAGLAGFALLICGLYGVAHLELALSSHIGLSWQFLREGFASGEGGEAIAHARIDEVLRGLVMPCGLAAAMAVLVRARSRRNWSLTAGAMALLSCVAAAGAVLSGPPPIPDAVPACANESPLWYFAKSLADNVSASRPAAAATREHAAPKPTSKRDATAADGGQPADDADDDAAAAADPPAAATPAAAGAMRLRDPAFVRAGANVAKTLPKPAGKRWNVVWLILESTGMRYALGKVTPADKPPMPFLQQLASEGWLLKRHHSTANSSAISIVSQLSGLYPSPTHYGFATRRDIAFPSLGSALGADVQTFFVTPGKLNYYFPYGFLKNSGFADVKGYDDVPVKKTANVQGVGRDEPATVDYFLRRIDEAKPPFCGVYYSFIAHWDYADYGPAWKRYNSSRTMDRYLNNLWLLDNLLKRIVDHLKETGRDKDTIVVLAGDHGEAFGQHEGNWSHPFAIYEENLEVPAVLWQPALFAPKADTRLTAHIDLLPTVLDAMGIGYDRDQFQGESLFQAELERKYLFGFGKDGAVFAIDPAGPKLQWPRDGTCMAYDLSQDPNERRKFDCGKYAQQFSALRQWKAWQRTAIAEYSRATLAKKPAATSGTK